MFTIRNQWLNAFINASSISRILKRYKSKNKVRFTPSARALDHFDDFYKVIFKEKWPSIRLGLLSKEKNVAVINNFGNTEETEKLLQKEGALDLRHFFETGERNIKTFTEKKTLLNINSKQTELDKVILKHQKEEEKKEMIVIYPENKEVKSKAMFYSEENDTSNKIEESDNEKYLYNPDTAESSLHSDMSKAQIDWHRFIPPSSQQNEALYEFIPTTQLRGLENFISESEYYKYYQTKREMHVTIEPEYDLEFPEHLKVYCFDRGDVSDFPDPSRCENDVYNFLEVDGAAILAVLALGIKPGDVILDMFSISGSKAYCIFQTLMPNVLICNKNKNVEKIFSQHLFDYSPAWRDMLLITDHDFNSSDSGVLFDKILVDVPCTNDRHSLTDSEDNFFAPAKFRQRLGLPVCQSEHLASALKLVRPGGTVIYSTATLSPVQNDGVVNEALKIAWEENKAEFTIKDLSPALNHTSALFNFGDYLGLKYGTLIVPFIPSNFGPRYFCKIVKNE